MCGSGGGGQLGPGLARMLRKEYGQERVILSDVRKPNNPEAMNGKFNLERVTCWVLAWVYFDGTHPCFSLLFLPV